MRFDKLTIKSQELIQDAQSLAAEHNNQQIEPEHLLKSMLAQDQGVAGSILRKLGTSPGSVAQELSLAIDRFPKISGMAEAYLSPRTKAVLDIAFKEATKMKDQYVSIEHFYWLLRMKKRAKPVKF